MERLPKVELHLHLDCSLSYSVVRRLNPATSHEEYRDQFVAPPQCSSLAEFLTRAPHGFQLMQSEESLELVVEDVFDQLVADRVIYAEIRFAPLLHVLKGLTPDAVVRAVDRATERCIQATGIEARLILCTLRHFNQEQSRQTVELVKQFQGSRVAALDIAGDEAGFALDPHIAAFRYAQEHGLYRTAHAGEARGADSVWETLRHLQPSRIGHGVRSIEDPLLVEHLRRHKLHLEVCPTSNVQTCVCPSYTDHPVDRLFHAGVHLGISTDARTISDITLDEEYQRLQKSFDWSSTELGICNRRAVQAAFIPDEVKQRLDAQIVAAYGEASIG